jgi:50S ribosomal protein L16 3-hydroxylase
MRDYWQKKPLLIRQAFPTSSAPSTPTNWPAWPWKKKSSRAWCSSTASARGSGVAARSPKTPSRPAGKDWTVLVQAVDQFVPKCELRKTSASSELAR